MVNRKLNFIKDVIRQITILINCADEIISLRELYIDLDYGDGEANEIVDEDCTCENISASDIHSNINLIKNFKKFLNNEQPVQYDWYKVANKIKRLP